MDLRVTCCVWLLIGLMACQASPTINTDKGGESDYMYPYNGDVKESTKNDPNLYYDDMNSAVVVQSVDAPTYEMNQKPHQQQPQHYEFGLMDGVDPYHVLSILSRLQPSPFYHQQRPNYYRHPPYYPYNHGLPYHYSYHQNLQYYPSYHAVHYPYYPQYYPQFRRGEVEPTADDQDDDDAEDDEIHVEVGEFVDLNDRDLDEEE